MKNLEVNSLGLMELDAREMISFDDGCRVFAISLPAAASGFTID